MVVNNIVKGLVGMYPPPSPPGLIFPSNVMYVRKRPLPLCVYSVVMTLLNSADVQSIFVPPSHMNRFTSHSQHIHHPAEVCQLTSHRAILKILVSFGDDLYSHICASTLLYGRYFNIDHWIIHYLRVNAAHYLFRALFYRYYLPGSLHCYIFLGPRI